MIYTYKPDFVCNCGAYTNVDKAEIQQDIAFKVNSEAPKALSEALLSSGGKLLQISTDFVFDGNQSLPYKPSQPTNPLGVYGLSKARGELAVLKILKNKGFILRTSWLIGPVSNNFALTMLKLHSERKEIKVISDQVGCPTSTKTLSIACWKLMKKIQSYSNDNEIPQNIFHFSDAGVASWYDLAIAVGEYAKELGILKNQANIIPITSKEYSSLAKRPHYSLLDSSSTRQFLDLPAIDWRTTLKEILKEIKRTGQY